MIVDGYYGHGIFNDENRKGWEPSVSADQHDFQHATSVRRGNEIVAFS
jgi:hypothetical protein